jgi:hypothetical protein
MRGKRLSAFVAFLCFCAGFEGVSSLTAAAFVTGQKGTLRGLKGVEVVIALPGSESERGGLTASQLQTDVELRLRNAGILVLTKEERTSTPGSPYLYVNAHVRGTRFGVYMFTITVQLTQKAILKRNPSAEASVTTWEGRSSMGSARDSQDIRIRVGNRVDEFINDYLSENPGGPAD